MSDTTGPDVAAVITRNIAIGLVVMFLLTVGIVLASGQDLGVSLAVAAVPAGFAGPFLGGLLTVIHFHRLDVANEGP